MSTSVPEKAAELFLEGYNCAQSIYAAFAPRMGITEKQAARLASALGGGLCRMRETCGAVSGGMMVLGALLGYDDPKDDEAKKRLYARGQRVMKQFKERYGTLNCLELLKLPKGGALSPVPTPRTQEFYQKRPCARFIYEMARLVEEELSLPEPEL
ncbi:MAG: C_GCAxxG_C_C family protein [Clostridiales bacterium]|nr:C_GCAxxG_C_C family protein [Clostridiales bacterium]